MKKRYLKLSAKDWVGDRNFFGFLIGSVILVAVIISSCKDDGVGDHFFTFKDEMMGEYLLDRPEEYSEFYKLLDTTDVIGLLNAYGEYTCFAPNNSAMHNYYEQLGKNSLKDFPYDTLLKVAYDHIIKDAVMTSDKFYEGRIASLSMSQRYISVSFKSFPIIVVNDKSNILDLDVEVHNGVIHEIDKVLQPTNLTIMGAIENDSLFTMFYEALRLTKIEDKMRLVEDESYNIEDWEAVYKMETINGNLEELPKYRKYGYTVLMESDSTFKANGIKDIEDLKDLAASVYDDMYPEDAGIKDLTDPKNSLNRFIAYHCFNKQMGYRKFIIDYDEAHQIKTYDMFEYIETMCPNTLVEVRTDRATSRTNLFNYNNETGECIQIVSDNYDNDAINGVYHEIDGILVFNRTFAGQLASKRLRMESAGFFPEVTNNNMRGNGEVHRYVIPLGYFDRLTASDNTKFCYLNADDRYEDFQGDEFWLKGRYEFEIITPPVPAGTYEVRIGYQPTPWRGVAQIYFDEKPCGIPLDLTIVASDPSIGWKEPGSDSEDPEGFENDKMMRNRGWMKGPVSYRVVVHDYYPAVNARMSERSVRRILGIYTFDEMKNHKYGVKGYKVGEFMIDYLEFVPLEVIEFEGID